MHYNYRWVFALIISVIILSVGYFYDLSCHQHRLQNLHHVEKALMRRSIINVVAKPRNMPSVIKSKKPINYLLAIAALASKHAVRIEKMSIVKSALFASNTQKIQLSVQGEYLSVAAFVSDLFHQSYAILPARFVYKEMVGSRVSFNGELIVTSILMPEDLIAQKPPQRSLFCSASAELVNEDTNVPLIFDSLNAIKMIGYMEQGLRKQALIMLSNRTLITVIPGMKLGSEHGEVIEIQPKAIKILLPNNKQFELRM